MGYQELVKKINEKIQGEGFIDKANNDLSMNEYHLAIGTKMGLNSATNPEKVLQLCSFIEVKKDESKKV